MSMAHKVKGDITDCDGSDSFKYTVFKDANCFIKGSLADLFKADLFIYDLFMISAQATPRAKL